MGLAGRKNKQRIGADPRNLTWSDDSSKFGAKYLQSLGWTSGSGLGATGDGRTSNLKIHQKLDLMGIGANRRGVDDASWKVGRQFDGLLARLNQAQNGDVSPAGNDAREVDGNDAEGRLPEREAGETRTRNEEDGLQPLADAKEVKRKEASEKRKRKREVEETEEDPKAAKRRRKQEKQERKERKRTEKEAKKKSRSNSEVEERTMEEVEVTESSTSPVTAQTVKVAPRYRAHRARNLASKRLAVTSTIGMNEILGIASSSLSDETRGPSSIPFPTVMTPPKQHPRGDDANGALLTQVKSDKEPSSLDSDNQDQISAMGLGARSSFGGGLGFGASKAVSSTRPLAVNGDDHLRKSGKSVAEYFAEKMRMKAVATKELMDPVNSDATRDEEPKVKRRKERK